MPHGEHMNEIMRAIIDSSTHTMIDFLRYVLRFYKLVDTISSQKRH